MNPNELLRIVDSLHREKNIDAEIVFQAIEAALVTAVRRQFGEEAEISVQIDRETAALAATLNGQPLDEETIGRIGAQTAKQVIIQKIREAERDSLVEEFSGQIDDMVTGVVQRSDGGRHRRSRWATSRPSCRAASRSPAKRTTPTSASGR